MQKTFRKFHQLENPQNFQYWIFFLKENSEKYDKKLEKITKLSKPQNLK
jgi:hypothetical protein